MSEVISFPKAHRRTATVSAMLCGDDLTKHLQRAVLAHMAAYGSRVTQLEVDRIMIKAGMQCAVSASGPTSVQE
jgi:hypothetical protein